MVSGCGYICVIVEVTFPRELPLSPTAIVHVVGYTKLRVWGLTQYERIVYIDADALVMDCVDEVSCRAYACALVAGRGWSRNPSIEENVYFSRLFWPDFFSVGLARSGVPAVPSYSWHG